jgi:hypothetical protein
MTTTLDPALLGHGTVWVALLFELLHHCDEDSTRIEKPIGITVQPFLPLGVRKAVRSCTSECKSTCQYPQSIPKLRKTFAQGGALAIGSSQRQMGEANYRTTWFKRRYETQRLGSSGGTRSKDARYSYQGISSWLALAAGRSCRRQDHCL